MDARQAACDNCRKAKVACGHERPVCTRCRHNEYKARTCVYRASPFKRKRSPSSVGPPDTTTSLPISRGRSPELQQSPSDPSRSHYPNPGYLGPSSHAAIFNQISSEQDTSHDDLAPAPSVSVELDDYPSAKQGALLTKQLLTLFDLSALQNLVAFWRAKGVNLAVAEPFVDLCADKLNYTSLSTFQDPEWHLNFSARLLQNTARPLKFDNATTLSTFSIQFLGTHTRWETFGIFLSAVIQATRDVPFFPPLYTTSSRNRELRRLLTRLIDCCLDVCLSADCLNDLQLILQYENFIVHSYVDGDQSKSDYANNRVAPANDPGYRYWRLLGDVVASISALGYHENNENKPGTPRFLVELRKTVFARTYSADKNVSIFLGRPLRMSKRFCHFQIPRCQSGVEDHSPADQQGGIHEWKPDACLSYSAETRWSALCALVKEDILEILFDRSHSDCFERAK